LVAIGDLVLVDFWSDVLGKRLHSYRRAREAWRGHDRNRVHEHTLIGDPFDKPNPLSPVRPGGATTCVLAFGRTALARRSWPATAMLEDQ
jgi:hypothetical protein